jgi:hypothetical protein
MDARYVSFLVRYWRAPGGARRIVVEHVQTGERVAVPSLADAATLLARWTDALASQPDASPDQGGREGARDPPSG